VGTFNLGWISSLTNVNDEAKLVFEVYECNHKNKQAKERGWFQMTKILVLIVGLAIIGFILWWFFGKHAVASVDATVTNHQQSVDIEVSGGYSPENVVLKQGVPAVGLLKK